jgi:hypothetical protein
MERGTERRHRLRNAAGTLIAGVLVCLAPFVTGESDYAAAWGPPVGAMAPLLAAPDQDGRRQSLDTLTGPNGLLVVFNRSVDW